jgi:hypothetical protein
VQERKRMRALERQADVLGALGEVLSSPLELTCNIERLPLALQPRWGNRRRSDMPSTLPMQWLRSSEV